MKHGQQSQLQRIQMSALQKSYCRQPLGLIFLAGLSSVEQNISLVIHLQSYLTADKFTVFVQDESAL